MNDVYVVYFALVVVSFLLGYFFAQYRDGKDKFKSALNLIEKK